jgi:FkbM family methyltransferase
LRQWFEYKLKKKLRKRYARVMSALVMQVHRLLALFGLKGREVVTSRYGVRMKANWSDRTFQYCYYATYGRFLSNYLRDQARDFVFLDIGANQGLYSLLAVRNPRCQAAIALEPVAGTFALLTANIAANDAAARIVPVRAALSDHCGEAAISVHAAHSGTATLADRSQADPAQLQTIELIDMPSLDALIPATADIVIKVDVEGHESVVLRELVRSRHAARFVAVFYEVDNRWSEAEALRGLLAAAGFDSFMRQGRGRHYDVLATRSAAAPG